MKDRRNLLIVTSLFCIILFKRIILLNMGLNQEESIDFSIILKIANGEVIYRDFYHIYGYLGLYFNAAIFKIFHIADIFIPRLVVSFFFALSSVFAYRIAIRFLPPFWALVAVLLGFSGLVAREHAYGHIFGFSGAMVALWGGLSYIHEKNTRKLGVAGLASGIAFAAQPLPVGVLSIFTLACLMTYHYFLRDNYKTPSSYIVCSLAILFFPGIGIIYFLWNGALEAYFLSFFSVFFGHEFHPDTYFFSYIPSIFPTELFSANNFGEIKAILNKFLTQNLKWWLITIFFIAGTVYAVLNLYKNKQNNHYLSILFLSAFLMVFEIEKILTPVSNSYMSLFPAYVLLIYFGIKINLNRYTKRLVQVMVFFLLLLYFIYSPMVYYFNFKKHAIPLNQKYAHNIKVMPYTHEIYKDATTFIRNNSGENDKIVVADYTYFFSLFSDRYNLYSDAFYTFYETSFHPMTKILPLSLKEQLQIEDKIIKKIKKEKPTLAVIPTDFLTAENIERSLFLQYISNNWENCMTTGDRSMKTVFDSSYINITIFCSSKNSNNFTNKKTLL